MLHFDSSKIRTQETLLAIDHVYHRSVGCYLRKPLLVFINRVWVIVLPEKHNNVISASYGVRHDFSYVIKIVHFVWFVES